MSDAAAKKITKARAYREAFGTEAGRFVLGDLIRHAGLWDTNTANYERSNALAAAHDDGMRDLLKYILHAVGTPDMQAVIDSIQTHTGTLTQQSRRN